MFEYISLTLSVRDIIDIHIWIEYNEHELWKRITLDGTVIYDGPFQLPSYQDKVIEQLEKLNIHKWQRLYVDEEDNPDDFHIKWHIDYKRVDKRCRHIDGIDNYPFDWDDFIYLMDQLAPEARLIRDDQIDHMRLVYYYIMGKGTRNQWRYEERVELDRINKKLIYERKVMDDCIIRHECQAKVVVARVMDLVTDLFFDCEFTKKTIKDNPYMHILVEYHDGAQYNMSVPYSRHGMSDEWNELIETIGRFLDFYGLFGDVFNPQIYGHGVLDDEFIYCSVSFDDSKRSYYYLTTDDNLMIGDEVIVPVGDDDEEKIGRIVNIEYFYAEDVPYPLEKTKSIIEKYSEHEHNFTNYLKTVN